MSSGFPELMEDGGLNSFDQIGGVVPSSSSSSSLGGNSGAETVGIGGGGESLGGIFNDCLLYTSDAADDYSV